MDLIERYIHEVGRYLPRKSRLDIQAELRSTLVDTLEDRTSTEPTEDDMAALLAEYGPPRKMAASYYPEGQYLVGPILYPLFRMIIGIVVAAVVGSQLLAWGIGLFSGEVIFNPLEAISGIINSIPMSIGWVVIVFAVLQRFDVRPEMDSEPWNPKSLPTIEETQVADPGGRIFGIVASVAILAFLVFFPQWVGFVTFPGGTFFGNPVIGQYLGWIVASLGTSIILDIYLLWQRRWNLATRIAKIGVNLLSILVLLMLLQGHNTWLAENGAPGFIASIEMLGDNLVNGTQMIGMHAFRLAFFIALIVTTIETVVLLFKLVTSETKKRQLDNVLVVKKF